MLALVAALTGAALPPILGAALALAYLLRDQPALVPGAYALDSVLIEADLRDRPVGHPALMD